MLYDRTLRVLCSTGAALHALPPDGGGGRLDPVPSCGDRARDECILAVYVMPGAVSRPRTMQPEYPTIGVAPLSKACGSLLSAWFSCARGSAIGPDVSPSERDASLPSRGQ